MYMADFQKYQQIIFLLEDGVMTALTEMLLVLACTKLTPEKVNHAR